MWEQSSSQRSALTFTRSYYGSIRELCSGLDNISKLLLTAPVSRPLESFLLILQRILVIYSKKLQTQVVKTQQDRDFLTLRSHDLHAVLRPLSLVFEVSFPHRCDWSLSCHWSRCFCGSLYIWHCKISEHLSLILTTVINASSVTRTLCFCCVSGGQRWLVAGVSLWMLIGWKELVRLHVTKQVWPWVWRRAETISQSTENNQQLLLFFVLFCFKQKKAKHSRQFITVNVRKLLLGLAWQKNNSAFGKFPTNEWFNESGVSRLKIIMNNLAFF